MWFFLVLGRRLNDGMGEYIASEVIKCMIKKNIPVNGSDILILGITFKENCPDVRNTKVVDLIHSLKDYGTKITIHDPWADEEQVMNEYNLKSSKLLPNQKFDAIVLAVAHTNFSKINFQKIKNTKSVIYDVKGFLGNQSDAQL